MSTSETDYISHDEAKRVNNPTMEQRGFMKVAEEKAPPMLYPRDPSLDPQLVWKGKDEQDREDLVVPTVPIYIQEKIMPSALIDDLRKSGIGGRGSGIGGEGDYEQLDLFAHTFNGYDLEEGQDKFELETDFYSHDKNWSNRMILGDSLLVMNSLAEKEGLKGKVQCIYLDPPYGIKFGSNWQVSTRKRDVKDGKAEDAAREPEVVRAFRDTWKLGIHSYLAYLRDRLVVARELLTETGSCFVQIGDENVHLVRCLMDEVFGSANFVAEIPFRKKTMPFGTNFIEQMGDYILWYAKIKETSDGKPFAKYRPLRRPANVEGEFHHCWYELADGTRHRMSPEQVNNHKLLPSGATVYRLKSLEPSGVMESGRFTYEFEGKSYPPPKNGYGTTPEGMARLEIAGRLQPEGNRLTFIMYAGADSSAAMTSPWYDTVGADDKSYVVQTNTEVVKRCLLMTTDPGDLVLDPTCGSGTTAYVAEQWGRRWITCDTSRVALALARTRLMAARYPSYLLSDSPEGIKKESELTGQHPPNYPTKRDIRQGFVYRRSIRVSVEDIANNDSIVAGMTRKLAHASIIKAAKIDPHYDQPYEDKKRIRVAGPFTVESLSPHRVLAADEEQPASQAEAQRDDAANDFVTMVIENLRKAGVQNTKKGERLNIPDLAPYAGTWLQASGTYSTADGETKRVAVSVGPEYGAVSPMQVKQAAIEACKGIGFDVLVLCGYAFDPHVGEESKDYGALTVLPARMNADLLMADDLLKKTGAGNLFMVFGEPDITVTRPDGQVVVELGGLDVFDPTTGVIRSNSVEDIACWFIDTNYNGESFFVRHAYFTGGDEPYEKLKKALKAEIDEGAWSALYSNVSRPFAKPETGKFAVKVINHYGDEVLKVYEVK